MSPDPGEELVSLEDVKLDGSNVRRRRGRAVKTFSQWIENEPKEKWCLMFDEGGARHEIKTINFAEVYNCMLRGARALPLVGIIEFFLYRTMQYFVDRSKVVHEAMLNRHLVYCNKMTEYLEKAQRKALLHRATAEPLQLFGNDVFRFRFGVECKAKGGLDPTEGPCLVLVIE